jgi:uncharacterized protein YoxC
MKELLTTGVTGQASGHLEIVIVLLLVLCIVLYGTMKRTLKRTVQKVDDDNVCINQCKQELTDEIQGTMNKMVKLQHDIDKIGS